MQEVEPHIIWTIFMYLSGSVLALAATLLVFVIIMHNILYRRFDSALFRHPWFSVAELAMYSSWPLSFLKAVQYMFLLTFPNYMRKKRFKGLGQVPPVSNSVKLASKIYMYTHILTASIGISWFLYGGIVLALDKIGFEWWVNWIGAT